MRIDKTDYTFDDEIVTKFSYDSNANKIEIQFKGCYEDGKYVESTCTLIIAGWQVARSKIHGESQYDSLESHLGIFSMILRLEKFSNKLELSINTIDDKYLELIFEKAKISIEKSV